jgi:hypothetical protein
MFSSKNVYKIVLIFFKVCKGRVYTFKKQSDFFTHDAKKNAPKIVFGA